MIKRLLEKISPKVMCILMGIVLTLSMLPVYYLSFFDRASGDDYGYGAKTHQAYLAGKSLIKVLKASWDTIVQYWYGWQGTWTSIFLFSLQPEVFSYKAYWIVPWVMSGLLILGLTLLLLGLMKDKMGCKRAWVLFFDFLLLFLIFQFTPGKKSMLFWWNGCAHYMVPLFLDLLALACLLRFLEDPTRKFRTGAFIGLCVTMTLLGGTNYLAAFLAPLLLILLVFLYLKKWKAKGKLLYLLIPFALEMIGLVISAVAPGNAIRGGDEYEVSLRRVLWAIAESFRQGTVGALQHGIDFPILILFLIVCGAFVWQMFRGMGVSVDGKIGGFAFPLPGLVLLYLYCTYCAMYWPQIFSAADVSSGVPNMILQVFILFVFLGELYFLGWLRVKTALAKGTRVGKPGVGRPSLIVAGTVVLLLLGTLVCRSKLKETTFWMCTEYISSGQASDYKDQMDEFTNLMTDDSVSDVVVPFINDWQGPLMHMPVTADKDAWTNSVACTFFNKTSVVAVSREEFEALQ